MISTTVLDAGGSGPRRIRIVMPVTVRQLAEATGLKPFRLIADLMEVGVFASMNQRLTEVAPIRHVAAKHGLEIEFLDLR